MANPNKQQEKAINIIDENVAVNAGAGTGKTKVLTERFIEILDRGKLKKGGEIESIVAITFTNKATQEMIERIRDQIKDRLVVGGKWVDYYRDLEKANISTIHGFCANMLKENPVEANIDPYFEILDDIKSKEILNKSILNVLNRHLEESKDLKKILELLDILTLDKIVEDFAALYIDIRTLGISIDNVYTENLQYLNSLKIEEDDINEIKEILEYLIEKMPANSKIAKLKSDQKWIDFYNKDAYEEEEIYHYLEYFSTNLGNSKKELDSQDRLKYLMQKVLITKEKKFDWYYRELIEIIKDIDLLYEEEKRSEGYLDYDDLQIKVLNLLENVEILEKYQDKYRYFMIDEFQDTNELQRKIFYKLCSRDKALDRKNLFIVGDPKQSIYGFRGADVEIFYDVVDDIQTYDSGNLISLDINYRSHSIVMNFVNNLFEKLMGKRYDYLEAFNKEEKDLNIEILERLDVEEVFHRENYSKAELYNILEADLVAKRIRKLIDEGRYEYRDMAILFRASTRTHIYEEALDNYAIPYYNSSSKRFFYKQEIKDIVNTLKAISNPLDKVSNIGFLKSPFVGLSDETIFLILSQKNKAIIDSLKNLKKEDLKAIEYEKILLAIDYLEYFYKIKDIYSIEDLILNILEKTNYLESLLLQDDGEQLMANINRFIDMTRSHDRENLVSLEEYIDYIDKLSKENFSEETIEMENANVVKILTIHGSKGLEFPVVFLPELAKTNYSRSAIFGYDKDLGLYIKNGIENGRYDLITDKIKGLEEEESERVFYVAMTRAEELLILGFQGGNTGFKKKINERLDLNKVKFIDEIHIDKNKQNKMEILKYLNKVEDSTHNFEFPRLIYDIDEYKKIAIDIFSATQYMKYRTCKRLYFLEHIWDIKIPDTFKSENHTDYLDMDNPRLENLDPYEDDRNIKKTTDLDGKILPGNIKGEIVHNFCSEYRIGIDKASLMDKSIKKYKIEPNRGVYSQVEPYINNYIDYYKKNYDKINYAYSEKPFYYKLEEAYVYGLIDRINLREDKVEIIDFKTNRIYGEDKEQIIEYYKPQLQLYAYAVEQLLGKKVEKSRILFLANNEFIDIDIKEEDLLKNIEKINDFTKFVNKNQDIKDYGKIENCKSYCKYKDICELI